MSERVEVEIVIVGSGIAGLAAANAAWEAGARRILVVESEGVVGGSSRLSGGIVMGAGTRIQREHGIEDSAEQMFHEYMAWNAWRVDAAVARRFCDRAGLTVDWLQDLGVPFTGNVVLGGDEPEPRTYDVAGGGQAIVDTLARTCRERDIDVALGKRVDHLLVDGRRVVGIHAGGEEVRADAVVIATGGFGANPDKLARFYPSAVHGDFTWYIGAEGARGDALDLAEQIGAQVTGHDRGLRLLHPNFFRILEAYQPAWVVVVNRQGRRFYDESAPYGIVDDVHRWQGDEAFVIFDDAQLRFTGQRAQYKDPVMAARIKTPNWTPDNVDIQVANGRMWKADTVGALAAAMGLPADVLTATIDEYNAGCAAGEDRQYAKAAKFLRPVSTPPFYAALVRPATVCLTSCGLRIDPDARVLGHDGHPIDGLFAAGECTGGVLGDRYMGSGNSIGNAATMGRVAGESAAYSAQSAHRP
jgi:fumarate reductase flavoprotein subunit